MRNIIVTGGSRGIGLGIARKLSASGFHVIAVARNSGAELESAMAEANAAGIGRISFYEQDLSKIEILCETSRALRKQFGSVYGIVNNAGLGTSGLLSDMPDAEIQRLTQLNIVSPLVLTKHLLRSMLVARSGRIVNIASIVAITGYQGISVYSATKAAMLGFTRSLAREVGSLGITVNAVLPGFVDTDMTLDLDETARRKITNRSALRRPTMVEDVASMVDYLVSDHASGVTGAAMVVDAGTTA